MGISLDFIIFPLLMLASAFASLFYASDPTTALYNIEASVIGFGWLWMVTFVAEQLWAEWSMRRKNGESWAQIMGYDKESLKRLSES